MSYGKPVDETRQTGTPAPQDAAALEPIFKACYALLRAYACKYVTRETAEDIIQDVFIQLYKKGPSLNIDTSIKAYLFRSVHNGCLDYIRREAVHQRYVSTTLPGLSEAELDYFSPDGPRQSLIQQDNLAASVWQAIEALPPSAGRSSNCVTSRALKPVKYQLLWASPRVPWKHNFTKRSNNCAGSYAKPAFSSLR
ncbi:sigma-70 family RNA polymerase sigma factor [Chitinophaga oryzae]|uniref:Sigma-70 family RNA polymerase sigma factor n=1 Tax=Chitinophaga oryzae TaxID=2725414 RepID=A0ABX6LFM5_9BACT|nr:sigma-70 family RNA polymerase sigma factor [Chitinophaga oryzae]QJB38632.1 sigma-70 family RNA polymerase sigma factor [Chitinophaga oryzae]